MYAKLNPIHMSGNEASGGATVGSNLDPERKVELVAVRKRVKKIKRKAAPSVIVAQVPLDSEKCASKLPAAEMIDLLNRSITDQQSGAQQGPRKNTSPSSAHPSVESTPKNHIPDSKHATLEQGHQSEKFVNKRPPSEWAMAKQQSGPKVTKQQSGPKVTKQQSGPKVTKNQSEINAKKKIFSKQMAENQTEPDLLELIPLPADFFQSVMIFDSDGCAIYPKFLLLHHNKDTLLKIEALQRRNLEKRKWEDLNGDEQIQLLRCRRKDATTVAHPINASLNTVEPCVHHVNTSDYGFAKRYQSPQTIKHVDDGMKSGIKAAYDINQARQDRLAQNPSTLVEKQKEQVPLNLNLNNAKAVEIALRSHTVNVDQIVQAKFKPDVVEQRQPSPQLNIGRVVPEDKIVNNFSIEQKAMKPTVREPGAQQKLKMGIKNRVQRPTCEQVTSRRNSFAQNNELVADQKLQQLAPERSTEQSINGQVWDQPLTQRSDEREVGMSLKKQSSMQLIVWAALTLESTSTLKKGSKQQVVDKTLGMRPSTQRRTSSKYDTRQRQPVDGQAELKSNSQRVVEKSSVMRPSKHVEILVNAPAARKLSISYKGQEFDKPASHMTSNQRNEQLVQEREWQRTSKHINDRVIDTPPAETTPNARNEQLVYERGQLTFNESAVYKPAESSMLVKDAEPEIMDTKRESPKEDLTDDGQPPSTTYSPAGGGSIFWGFIKSSATIYDINKPADEKPAP